MKLRRLMRRHGYLFALVIAVVLLGANAAALPSFVSPSAWDSDLGILAPSVLAAMASTPSVLGGGLDISVGPLMNFIEIVFVVDLLPHGLGSPEYSIPILLAIGAAVGVANGVAVTMLRYQPVIATLCTFFILGGVSLIIVPTSLSAPTNWTRDLNGSVGPLPGGLVAIAVVAAIWMVLRVGSFHRSLYAVGADDAAAYASGLNVARVRIAAYGLGGLFAAVGGLSLAGLVQSANSIYGEQYALIGIAGMALGGTVIGGGRGGLLGSLLGAATIYLAQNLLLSLHISVIWEQVVYGAFLIVGVTIGAVVSRVPRAEMAT